MTVIIHPVILCGGSGTRLWPLSRTGFPKQFLALTGNETLFQQSVRRVLDIQSSHVHIHQLCIVTNEEHRFLALDQLGELVCDQPLPHADFLLEPVGKNTAPALILAAMRSLQPSEQKADGKLNLDPILLVTPADQVIQDQGAFKKAMHSAIAKANEGFVVVLGIKPSRAETGYGYIQFDSEKDAFGSHTVTRFTEKPSAQLAQQYVADPHYAWNGGMFVLKASIWLQAISKFRPDIYEACERALEKSTVDSIESNIQFIRPSKALFGEIPAESIDYAVIEKLPGSGLPIAMVPLDVGWSDLGAWDAVWQVGKADESGNVSYGDVLISDSHYALVHANSRLVSLVGLDNVVVVETADAVLVASRDKSQDVKSLVEQLTKQGREEKNLHRKVHRPWGWYDSIDEGPGFKVKRIQVKPGASLSLQMHHHRAEHWIVVKGVAEVTNGDAVMTLSHNESTFIPMGAKHRLKNPGSEPLEIIEVQSGTYLGEDDIVRFEDQYHRV
jgi:mannose-1-phosphate guanylyltransferase/mannose-6-phosphate isomerase